MHEPACSFHIHATCDDEHVTCRRMHTDMLVCTVNILIEERVSANWTCSIPTSRNKDIVHQLSAVANAAKTEATDAFVVRPAADRGRQSWDMKSKRQPARWFGQYVSA